MRRFDVRGTESGGLDTLTRGLSGGNMQKLILGRALTPGPGEAPPRLIVANQPTWGLDVGAVAYVHQQLLDACAAGAAVLLISEDLDEIFALADRIAVMHQGHLSEARPRPQWTLASIGLAMAGGEGATSSASADTPAEGAGIGAAQEDRAGGRPGPETGVARDAAAVQNSRYGANGPSTPRPRPTNGAGDRSPHAS